MKDSITNQFECKKITGGKASGEVLVSTDDICFFLCNPRSGELFEAGHSIEGQVLAGKVLVFPSGKGSCVVQDEGLFALQEYGNLPSAFIVEQPDTVLVFGALLLELPIISNLDPVAYTQLKNGVTAIVDADSESLQIS